MQVNPGCKETYLVLNRYLEYYLFTVFLEIGMKRLVLVVASATVLAGCATNVNRSAVLAELPGVTYAEDSPGWFTVKEFSFDLPKSKASKDQLALCLTDNLHVSDVRLSDGASSFYGYASQKYYNIGSSEVVAGESVLQYVADDGSGAVARGQMDYTFSTSGGLIAVPIQYIVRFTVKYKRTQEQDQFVFHNIQAAQTYSGSMPNSGFGPLTDLEMFYPEKAYIGMEKIAKQLNTCFRQG